MSYIWLFIFTIKWNLIRLLSYFVSVINEKICLHNNQIPCTTIKFLAQQSNFFWPSKKNIIPCTTIKFLIYRKKIWIKFLEHLPNQCTQKKKFYILKKTLSICLAHQYQTLRLWPPTVFFFFVATCTMFWTYGWFGRPRSSSNTVNKSLTDRKRKKSSYITKKSKMPLTFSFGNPCMMYN